jgi:DNA-binding NarL/FixJ family response regulator
MGKIKIILVDDHNVVREGISNSFQKEDNFIVIGEADTGRAAIELVSSSTPDIVIMDISMPDLNGVDATKQILSINPKIKVIALSMYSDKAYVMGMLNAGVSGYLIKSCSFKELLLAVDTVLLGEMYLCAKVTPIVVENSLGSSRNKNIKKSAPKLSQREREVLQLLSEGQNTNTIAKKLNISPKTVSAHLANIKTKLNIHNIAALTKFAISKGITTVDFT